MSNQAKAFFEQLTKSYPLYADLEKQRKKFNGNFENLNVLIQKVNDHDNKSEELKVVLETDQNIGIVQDNKQIQLESLNKKDSGGSEEFSKKIVDNSENNKEGFGEKKQKWHNITETLIVNKEILIDETAGTIEMVGSGLKMVTKLMHDSVVNKAFEKMLETRLYKNPNGDDQYIIEVEKYVLDRFIREDKSFEGGNRLAQENDINIMIKWIAEKYHTQNKDEQLYILQIINPDLFGHYWIDQTNGESRIFLNFIRSGNVRVIDQNSYSHCKRCLFLLQNT